MHELKGDLQHMHKWNQGQILLPNLNPLHHGQEQRATQEIRASLLSEPQVSHSNPAKLY